MSPRIPLFLPVVLAMSAASASVRAAEIKVLTTGGMKQVVLALAPKFETLGHRLIVDNDTEGALLKRIEAGEAFDVALVSPGAFDELMSQGKIMKASGNGFARVGIGIMVRKGAKQPDISNVEAFKRALFDAKSIAYADPANGDWSGIYLDQLFKRMGIADAIRAKTKLQHGGYVADLLVSGEAELGIQQVSEIVGVKGVVLVGSLPSEINRHAIYAGAISRESKNCEAAKAFLYMIDRRDSGAIMAEKGIDYILRNSLNGYFCEKPALGRPE